MTACTCARLKGAHVPVAILSRSRCSRHREVELDEVSTAACMRCAAPASAGLRGTLGVGVRKRRVKTRGTEI